MGAGTTEITEANFKETVSKDGIVLLDWWAPWCGPCRTFAPIFEKVAGRNTDIIFGKINTEEQQALAAAFEIRSIPTLMIFRERILLFAQPGALHEPALDDLIRQVRALDMNDVRQKVAQAQADQSQGTQKPGTA